MYYDLLAGRKDRNIDTIAIVRLEQLYPFPTDDLAAEVAKFANATEIMWVQEEPRNQGAWYQIRHRLEKLLTTGKTLSYAGRDSSASPAAGYMSKHTAQLKAFVEQAMSFQPK